MPANLPPQYFEAEKVFREAKNPLEKIAALEEMLAIMPKHKGTDHLRAELRGRIAKLTQLAAKKSGTRRASLVIEREGAAQAAVIGLPQVPACLYHHQRLPRRSRISLHHPQRHPGDDGV